MSLAYTRGDPEFRLSDTVDGNCMKYRLLLLVCVLMSTLALSRPVLADAAQAARYYEDGLARFERGDAAGAVIQIRNALQQDATMLAARLLLARAYLAQREYGPAEVAFEDALRLGVDRSEVAVPLGQLYLARGKPADLLERIQSEGLPAPVRFEVLSMRGVAHALLGDAEQAEESFALARRLAPDAALPLVQEVPSLLASGRLELAETRAQRAVELEPDNPRSWNVLASVDHARGALNEALAHYGRALELEPDYVDVRVARAGLLVDLGQTGAALADLLHLEQAGLDDPRAAYLRALLAMRDGDNGLAASKLQQATELIDMLPAEFVAGREQLLMAGALSHHALGQTAKAQSYLDVLVNRYPRNQGARRLLASLLVDAGDFGPARSMLEGVLRAQPDDPQSHLLMGRIMLAQGRTPQALSHFERALELAGDDDRRVQAALGAGLAVAGEREQAVVSLERALDEDALEPQLVATLATLHLRGGNVDRARELAHALAVQQPDSAFVQNLLGVVEGVGGNLDAAGEAYRRVLALDPDNHAASLNLARVDAAQGRREAARARLQAMVERNRRDHAAMYELGLLEMAGGDSNEGVSWLERAFAERPPAARVGVALVEALMHISEPFKAVDTARLLVSRHSGDMAALEVLVRAQLAAGNPGGALQTLRDMSRRAEFDAALQVSLGYLQLEAGGAEDAAYSAHKALTGRPGDPAALVLATEAALALNNIDRARESLDALAQLDPLPVAHGRLSGELALREGDLAAAEAYFAGAFAAAPDRQLLTRRLQVLMRMEAPERAIALATEWLEARPDDMAARAMLAELYLFVEDWPRARTTYQRIVDAGAANAAVLNNLANAQNRLDDPVALDTARKAFALDPSNPYVVGTLGWLLVRAGNVEEGLRYLRDARLRAPDVPDIRYYLAFTLAELGLTAEAQREVSQALASDAHFVERGAAEVLARALGGGG